MSHFVPIDPAPACAPRRDVAAPERPIEGASAFQTWELDSALAETATRGEVRTGIWDGAPGATRSIKGETFEFCHGFSGGVETGKEGGETRVFGADDSFVPKPGVVGTWKTFETVRNTFVIAS